MLLHKYEAFIRCLTFFLFFNFSLDVGKKKGIFERRNYQKKLTDTQYFLC